jgi:pyruvate/2-oxoglutarate dehydrogenase complex dihydrolipoamide acyltransferase (E2) component
MVQDTPTAVNGEIKSQKVLKCTHTVDHRMWNTAIFADFMKSCKHQIEEVPDFSKI